MICNLCGNETTEAGNAFIALPFGVICEECSNEIESSKKYEPKKITPEQLEKIKTILNNQEGN
jgi:hypothetical protein